MSSLKLSIITVCFNAEKSIERTIQSVAAQTYENIEYIIIDGKSTDNTLDILSQYSNHISKVVSEPDKGIYDAMNKGASFATGDYLLFLNADDYLFDERVITNIFSFIDKSTLSDIYFGELLLNDQTNGHAKLWQLKKVNAITLYSSTLPHPSTLISKDTFATLKGYDLNYRIAADFDFFVRAYCSNLSFTSTKILTSVFSIGGTSTTPSGKMESRLERRKILNQNFSAKYRAYLAFRARMKKILNL